MKIITILLFIYTFSFAQGSFIDKENHLQWQDSPDVEKEEKWAMSKKYCKTLHYLGYNDWRLPTIAELKTITDVVQHPKPGKKFEYGTEAGYWSSEEYEEDDLNAWAVYMQTAHLFWDDKCEDAYRRCVRNKF